MFDLEDYAYVLPEDRIAQKPCDRRDASRLLRLGRSTGAVSHHVFGELPGFITPGDVLVVNDTKVIPGRLLGRKDTGGKAEVLILSYAESLAAQEAPEEFYCTCLVKCSKKPRVGSMLYFDEGLRAEIVAPESDHYRLKFTCDGDFDTILNRTGRVPLPPYIHRSARDSGASSADSASYQTVYAAAKGAIAAPTAGFHFTPDLMLRLKEKNVRIVALTLHVGYGTFIPVRVSDIRKHRMHHETFRIGADAATAINDAKASGHRVIAVGTTSVRTLEYCADANGTLAPRAGSCDLFIYPGYRFKVVDAMITNFHLPRSTLLMLVSAFAGRNHILEAYAEAIASGYRFYSYGDAMLIE